VAEGVRAVGIREALGIEGCSGLVAIVGGGGKSSLMFALAESLPGRVVMTTTTRIFASQMDLAEAICQLEDAHWQTRLDSFGSGTLVVASVEGERAVGVPVELPGQLLARPSVDWVVVEADGSRMLPVKAPAAHEPVVPGESDWVVAVAGIDALSGPIRDVAHRPELVSAITEQAVSQPLTPESLAALLASSEGGLKNVPDAARAVLLINKVETPSQRDAACRVARAALEFERVDRVAIGALKPHDSAEWEAWVRR
jgi:molybdenum cofactor cytidylyltransferase